MVIGFQIRKLHRGGGIRPPPAVLDSKRPGLFRVKPKFKFHLPGYDIYKNDRLVGTKGGVAILVKKGIIVNKEWKNEHFNVITDNEALAVEMELQ